MKVEVEPQRLRNMFSQLLVYKGGGLVKSCPVVFTKNGVQVRAELAPDLMILANYSADYFIHYGVEENEPFTITESLLKERLAYGFKGEKVTLWTDDEYIYIEGEEKDDKVKEKLTETNIPPFPLPVVVDKNTGLTTLRRKRDENGNIITKEDGSPELEPMPFAVRVLIPTSLFSDLPSPSTHPNVKIEFKNQEGYLKLEDVLGSRKRPVVYSKGLEVNDLSVTFDLELMQRIMSQFTGEVWLSLSESFAYISQKNKDYMLTYLMGAKYEEE